jgi:4-diphosphocytidyl-2-C-methyl-D-erythritol kinase
VIFENDYRLVNRATVGWSYFRCNASRLYSVMTDPASWGQQIQPRITATTNPSKIVFSFEGRERVTVNIQSWSSELCAAEIVIEEVSELGSQASQEKYWSEVCQGLGHRLNSSPVVVASSPGKLNVFFAVGAFLKDGFHEIASCYQALSLREKVVVELTGEFSIGFAGPFANQSKQHVPTDTSNLVYRAGVQLGELGSSVDPSLVSFLIHKSVPIAGGMAGGSADAAAALVALNELFGADLDNQLEKAAAKLGSDVPFSLIGGTAIGLGRGELLEAVNSEAILHWVVTPSLIGLSTPDVYRKLDVMRIEAGIDVSSLEAPTIPAELIEALVSGDVETVAEYMHNDLEIAALALRPELELTIKAGMKAGALRSMVSGSGPTIVHLAKDRVHAEQILSRLALAGYPSVASFTSLTGTYLEI